MTNIMGKEFTIILMAIFMKVNIEKGKNGDLEHTSFHLEPITKAIIKLVKNVETEYL